MDPTLILKKPQASVPRPRRPQGGADDDVWIVPAKLLVAHGVTAVQIDGCFLDRSVSAKVVSTHGQSVALHRVAVR